MDSYVPTTRYRASSLILLMGKHVEKFSYMFPVCPNPECVPFGESTFGFRSELINELACKANRSWIFVVNVTATRDSFESGRFGFP